MATTEKFEDIEIWGETRLPSKKKDLLTNYNLK